MDRNYDCLVKVLLCGDSGVGKTCLISQFTDGQVRKSHITTIGKQSSLALLLCIFAFSLTTTSSHVLYFLFWFITLSTHVVYPSFLSHPSYTCKN